MPVDVQAEVVGLIDQQRAAMQAIDQMIDHGDREAGAPAGAHGQRYAPVPWSCRSRRRNARRTFKPQCRTGVPPFTP
jgi:hypothetical protein